MKHNGRHEKQTGGRRSRPDRENDGQDRRRRRWTGRKAAGGALLPVAPNGTVWVIHRRRAVSATVMFVGAGADGLTSFSVLRGRPGTTAWSSMQFTEQQIGQVVFLTREDALAALGGDLT